MNNINLNNLTFIFNTEDKKITKEKFKLVKGNNLLNKPAEGGLWSSVYRPYKIQEDFITSEWDEFATFEFNDKPCENYILFKVSENSKILIIDSEEDGKKLFEKYSNRDTIYGRKLDFESIAKDYDGLYLTSKGQEETRFSHFNNDPMCNLYGWDVESLLIFNFDIIENQKCYTKEELYKKYKLEEKQKDIINQKYPDVSYIDPKNRLDDESVKEIIQKDNEFKIGFIK